MRECDETFETLCASAGLRFRASAHRQPICASVDQPNQKTTIFFCGQVGDKIYLYNSGSLVLTMKER